ncbi:MAG: hypothetical protein ACQESP_12875 [Candidatus Muiribacteriota bacterium]
MTNLNQKELELKKIEFLQEELSRRSTNRGILITLIAAMITLSASLDIIDPISVIFHLFGESSNEKIHPLIMMYSFSFWSFVLLIFIYVISITFEMTQIQKKLERYKFVDNTKKIYLFRLLSIFLLLLVMIFVTLDIQKDYSKEYYNNMYMEKSQ